MALRRDGAPMRRHFSTRLDANCCLESCENVPLSASYRSAFTASYTAFAAGSRPDGGGTTSWRGFTPADETPAPEADEEEEEEDDEEENSDPPGADAVPLAADACPWNCWGPS